VTACADDEDEAPPALDPGSGLALELGHGCYQRLVWELTPSNHERAARLLQRLPGLGFRDESRHPTVREFADPSGHLVVLVPKTGRVQLRIHYLTPVSDRREAARTLGNTLSRALL
jgi:hypothetical protein